MGKIYHFPDTKERTIKESIENSANIADQQESEAIAYVIAVKCKDGSWLTGYHNADWGTRNEALGHIQADIIDQMIRNNPERY
jgi:hypothetical protein